MTTDFKSEIVAELYKPARRRYPTRKVILRGISDLIQFDLAEMQDYSKENNGNRYILVGINCFSKVAFAVPLLNKTAKVVAKAADKLLEASKTAFKLCQTDAGSEFLSVEFQRMLASRNIKHYTTYSDFKASIVERFLRTIKNKIYRTMALRSSLKYIDFLDELIQQYNNTKHRTIKMTPNEVSKRGNEKLLLSTVYNYERPIVQPRFKIGDFVRVSKKKFIFSKAYFMNWSPELFIIHSVNKKSPVTYHLSSYDKKEVIKGSFYEAELQKAKHKDIYLVEKVLKKIGKNRSKVRWLGFGEEHDSIVENKEIY